jgi:hypothetical protein
LVPKPHTLFQWVLPAGEENRTQQDYLKEHLRGPGLKLNWNMYQETLLEAVLSRGDRRLDGMMLPQLGPDVGIGPPGLFIACRQDTAICR